MVRLVLGRQIPGTFLHVKHIQLLIFLAEEMVWIRGWPLCATSTLKSVIAGNCIHCSIRKKNFMTAADGGGQRCQTDCPSLRCPLARWFSHGLKNLEYPSVPLSLPFDKFEPFSRNLHMALTGRDEIAFTRPARER